MGLSPRQKVLRNNVEKKPIYIICIAGSLWAACSSGNELPEQPDVPQLPEEVAIQFGSSIGETTEYSPQTRAEGLENKVKSFKLYGYKNEAYDVATQSYNQAQTVINGYTVNYNVGSAGSTTSNSAGWEYVDGTTQTIKYWDFSATAYRFMAYAQMDAKEGVTMNKTTDEVTFTFTADGTTADKEAATPYVSEMWFSNNAPGCPEYGKPVQLVFSKPFSKVRFMLIGEDGQPLADGSELVGLLNKDYISFQPEDRTTIGQKAQVTVTYPLTGTATTESYKYDVEYGITEFTIPYEDVETPVLSNTKKQWYTVLSNTNQGPYRLSLVINNATRSATVPAEYMQWKRGYQYTYVFKVSAEGLTFQPQFYVYDKWQVGYVDDDATW